MYYHIIRTANKLEILENNSKYCKDVENSISSFSSLESAKNQLNNTKLL
jgi:hypothetical protein